MLQINLSVNSIRYEEVLHMVYPTVLEKLDQTDSQDLLIRLLKELGQDGEKVVQTILSYLSEYTKNELLCQCLNSQSAALTEMLNAYLQTDVWGRNFTIGSCRAIHEEENLMLAAESVQADMKALLIEAADSQNVENAARKFIGDGLLGKLAAKAAAAAAEQIVQKYSAMSEEELEHAGISLLDQPMVQERILKMISDALQEKSLAICVDSISIEKTDPAVVSEAEERNEAIHLTPELENELLKALAEFMREKL